MNGMQEQGQLTELLAGCLFYTENAVSIGKTMK